MTDDLRMEAVSHLHLTVTDVDRSAAFYERHLGLQRQWREGDMVFLRCGAFDLALAQGRPSPDRRFHFGFRLGSKEEVERWRSKLAGAGIAPSFGPRDYGGYLTFTVEDPDGYGIEIYFEDEPVGRFGTLPQDEAAAAAPDGTA